MHSYFFKYLLTGFLVTTYSFLFLYFFGRHYFLIAYLFVEISSSVLKTYCYQYYVFRSQRHNAAIPFDDLLKKCIVGVAPIMLINSMMILFIPVSIVTSIVRAILISIIVGYFLSYIVFSGSAK